MLGQDFGPGYIVVTLLEPHVLYPFSGVAQRHLDVTETHLSTQLRHAPSTTDRQGTNGPKLPLVQALLAALQKIAKPPFNGIVFRGDFLKTAPDLFNCLLGEGGCQIIKAAKIAR